MVWYGCSISLVVSKRLGEYDGDLGWMLMSGEERGERREEK